MARKNLGKLRERYSGLINFLNVHLDERNWRQAVHAVAGSYATHRRPTETPIAIAIDRDLTCTEAKLIQDKLKILFANERPRGMATLDAMQAVWFVASALVQEHDGPRKCQAPGCFRYFIPKGSHRTCSNACSTKHRNARSARQRRLAAGKRGTCTGLQGTGDSCIFDTNHAGPHRPATRRDGEPIPPGTLHP